MTDDKVTGFRTHKDKDGVIYISGVDLINSLKRIEKMFIEVQNEEINTKIKKFLSGFEDMIKALMRGHEK